ncbi:MULTISPECIES: GspH/FimT family pseudopilin [unclassified Roseateles]|uniref:GspH/FimT family pseudopilin n=1 Tax=unclassified Roseateles TaxID=2626991 RepID=UPI001484F55A|nr:MULTISPECIES: GspH/FimT family pseudopilin [unclassified Roseateles]MCZ7884571.1 GspH/FimT family pseudopilin [Paucibacter sp. M5-1]MDC6165855.1 GspH/FimT family pseudopilin [Paucibacter sp. XJ19-41]
MPQAPHPSHHLRGLSLIEVCVVCLILAVLLSQAIPSMQRLRLGQHVRGTAQTLMTDLQQARSVAVIQGKAVHMRFNAGDGGSCYIVYSGPSDGCHCDNAGQTRCTDAAALAKVEWLPAKQATTIRANVEKLSFQARQGAVTSTGSIDIAAPGGPSIRHIVAITGRVRSCSPDGSAGRLPRCAG